MTELIIYAKHLLYQSTMQLHTYLLDILYSRVFDHLSFDKLMMNNHYVKTNFQ